MLCLCSDLLHIVLPTYRTAEVKNILDTQTVVSIVFYDVWNFFFVFLFSIKVRENELVRFSYNKWENVKMMHHIFCYQPSPVKKHFSHDSDEVYTISNPSNQT